MISNMTRTALAFVACLLIGVGLAACGSAASDKTPSTGSDASAVTPNPGGPSLGTLGKGAVPIPADAVAQVGNVQITEATLNEWMSHVLGGDAYESVGLVAPRGLVSDPPNYPRCESALRRLLASSAASHAAQFKSKCEELYQALKQQTLTTLIESQWAVARDAELGIKVDNQEVEREFERVKATQFRTTAALHTYLAQRGWSLSVELELIKRDMLGARLLHKVKGVQALTRLARENPKKGKAETSCRAGYVVESCREYTTAPATPSPNVLLEEIVAWR